MKIKQPNFRERGSKKIKALNVTASERSIIKT